MGFLCNNKGGGGSGSGSGAIKYYTTPIDNTSFTQSDSIFKTKVTHNLNTTSLIVQVDNGGMVEFVNYKYLSNNEIEFYYKSASDVIVTIIGFGNINQDDLSIVGLGVIGKIVLGKSK